LEKDLPPVAVVYNISLSLILSLFMNSIGLTFNLREFDITLSVSQLDKACPSGVKKSTLKGTYKYAKFWLAPFRALFF
jgi:hypothetical protein